MGQMEANFNIKSLKEERNRDIQYAAQEIVERVIKKCPYCGRKYSYNPETERDPGMCHEGNGCNG